MRTEDYRVDDEQAQIKVGLIGIGQIGRVHYDVLSRPPLGLQLAAVADPNPSVSKLSVPLYPDYRAILRRSDIDAVSVSTPPNSHYQIAMDALKAHKHVLVEKPPALTVQECEEMIALAVEQEKVLFWAFHARYNRVVETVRKELTDKNIKAIKVLFKECALNFHRPGSWVFNPTIAGGGVLIDSGINAVSLITYIMPDANLTVLDAKFQFKPIYEVETAAEIRFRFGSDGVGVIALEWMHEGAEQRQITILTGHERYEIDLLQQSMFKNGMKVLDNSTSLKRINKLLSEYIGLYSDFAQHIEQGRCNISIKEMRFVEDSYQLARSLN